MQSDPFIAIERGSDERTTTAPTQERRQLSLAIVPEPLPTRAECIGAARPCQRLDCKMHLWSTERRPGRRWAGREHLPGVMRGTPETCALDVTEVAPDGLSRASVGKLLGLSAERVRQIEEAALAKLGAKADKLGLK